MSTTRLAAQQGKGGLKKGKPSLDPLRLLEENKVGRYRPLGKRILKKRNAGFWQKKN